MSILVHDGILIGNVYAQLLPSMADVDAVEKQLTEELAAASLLADTYQPVVCAMNPYDGKSWYYVGYFQEWSTRRAMSLDDLWTPLYMSRGNVLSILTTEHKSGEFDPKKATLKDLQNPEFEEVANAFVRAMTPYIPNFVYQNVDVYEARRFT
ncbi:hypothetical protein KBD71_05310 [Candidatus Woesebacteria bacterium]|nr:hypothetical protein [Candidatus Woesebacteria bacterium]